MSDREIQEADRKGKAEAGDEQAALRVRNLRCRHGEHCAHQDRLADHRRRRHCWHKAGLPFQFGTVAYTEACCGKCEIGERCDAVMLSLLAREEKGPGKILCAGTKTEDLETRVRALAADLALRLNLISPCAECKGTGQVTWPGSPALSVPPQVRACERCNGTGRFHG